MSEVLVTRDLSVIEDVVPGSEWDQWLSELQVEFRARDGLIVLGDSAREDEEWVIARNEWGKWATGRFIGEISFKGRRLEIRPRFEGDFVEWLEGALNVAVIANSSSHDFEGPFMTWILATMWVRALDQATRHGLPSLKRDRVHVGEFVRGRLDVRGTVQLKARGSMHAASVMRSRDLDNDISRTIVAAERLLSSALGGDFWQPQPIRDSLVHIRSAVGPRPTLPTAMDLKRIRYTPITRPFRAVTEMSWRIARREGLSPDLDSGAADGVLHEGAELWELFVVASLRNALPGCRVDHGTTSDERTFLLNSDSDRESTMGRLKPDVLVFDRDQTTLLGVIDAKYKHLRNTQTRPNGVDRGDLYQLTSYQSKYDAAGNAAGMLVYPFDPDLDELSSAESGNPWRDESGSTTLFVRIPTSMKKAVPEFRKALELAGIDLQTDAESEEI